MQRRSQAGQALVLASLGLTLFMLAAGLAIDMGYLRYQKRRMQSAADSAALAGAAELTYGDWQCAANVDSSVNGFTYTAGISGCPGATTTTGTSTLTITCSTALSAAFSGTCNTTTPYLKVQISQAEPTFFMKVAGFSSVPVSASAVGYFLTGCMYALSNAPDALLMAEEGVATNPAGGNPGINIFDPGNPGLSPSNLGYPETLVAAPGCALISDGGLTLPYSSSGGRSHFLATSEAGGITVSDSGNTNEAPPAAPIHSASDPLAYLFSSGSATTPASVSPCTGPALPVTVGTVTSSGGMCGVQVSGGGMVTFQPGSYQGGIQISGTGTVFFAPGAYSLSGNGLPCPTPLTAGGAQPVTFGNSCSLSINGTGIVQGTGLTFYNSSGGSVAINYGASLAGTSTYDGATVRLSSGDGSSGGIAGILFYQDPSNIQAASITLAGYNGTVPPSSYLWGALYFPTAQLTLYGIGLGAGGGNTDYCSTTPRVTTVVSYQLILDGNLNFSSNDCDWSWPSPPTPYTFTPPIQDLIKAAVLVE